MPGVGIGVALRVAGVLHVLAMLDVPGDLLGPVVYRGQIIKWAAAR